MHTLVAICLLAATVNETSIHTARASERPATDHALVRIPKEPNRITLSNEAGEPVVQCEKKGDTFTNCRIDSGMESDDVVNAWFHARKDTKN